MATNLGRVLFSAVLIVILLSSPFLKAQRPEIFKPAPVPAQVLHAKNVFVSNAPGDLVPDLAGGKDRAYNLFYGMVASWGQYQLVSSPAQADVVFEISYTDALSNVSGTSSTGCTGQTNPLVRLVLLDPSTRTPLWWFAEPVMRRPNRVFGSQPFSAAFDAAVSGLAYDLKKLTATAGKPGSD